MVDKKALLSFDEVFPNVKGSKKLSKAEVIKLAKKVATALEEESERLVEEKEQPDPPSTRFFY